MKISIALVLDDEDDITLAELQDFLGVLYPVIEDFDNFNVRTDEKCIEIKNF